MIAKKKASTAPARHMDKAEDIKLIKKEMKKEMKKEEKRETKRKK